MKKKKVKNPLIRRIPRELTGDWKKYLVVSLFLILTIGFVSGMYVANGSMMKAAREGVTTYRLEDGHFELSREADAELLSALSSEERKSDGEAFPVSLYENFYRNREEDNNCDGNIDGTIRVYRKTEDINLACLMDGSFPEAEDEIAIDRMHADNVGLKVGDTIQIDGLSYRITGLIAYVNYGTLHEKSTDFMFDALQFDVAMVTDAGFDRLSGAVHYAYAWKYAVVPEDEKEEKQFSDDFLETLFTASMTYGTALEDYMPAYANPAIHFATDDMGSDEAMGGVLLDILIVIIAFIFAVTISNTIAKESSAIGTLRASGYSRGELVRHYLSMPVIVTLLAAAVGNILGYTVFKYVVVSMYYNSYSLPTYETVWNAEAFVKTTLIPVALMFAVNLFVIIRMMRHTPLQFLRHDLKKKKRKKAIRLPGWKFLRRFRMRIILQNIPNYLILFLGICFIATMLSMAVGMPDTLQYYKDHVEEMMFAKYQYVLRSYEDSAGGVIGTGNADAEEFGIYSLQKKTDVIEEEISIYGVAEDSRYVEIDDLGTLQGNEVYISDSFAQKYNLSAGDSVTLDEKYEERSHQFQVVGIYEESLSLAVFMPMQNFRAEFDMAENAFSGYLSDTEITDIEEEAIATVITKRDITKMCDQLDHSMGAYMQYFQVLCMLLSAVLIYLLTKIIIEKNETAISMTKILGYENREIAGLYLLSTTVMVVISDVLSVFVGTFVMGTAWKTIMAEYNGWFEFATTPLGYGKIFGFILIGYLLVMVFDFKRIKKIPMDEALKNVE
ncbi:MAG: permease [bacterium]|nr:permease [bacterium]